MDIGALLQEHVYAAIVFGSFIESETTAVLAGYASHQGHARWVGVALVAALVHFAMDQTWFLLGRWRGEWLLTRFPTLRRGVDRIAPRLFRHRRWFAFSVRFLYGLRTVGPIAMGLAKLPWIEFLVCNALGCLAWGAVYTGLGYLFGQSIATFIGRIAQYEGLVAALLVLVGTAIALWLRHRRARSLS